MNLIDLFDDDFFADRTFHREAARHTLSNPCEDSHEAMHANLSVCPEESDKEHGSPLNFGMGDIREMDRQYQAALAYGMVRVPPIAHSKG
jgi:hypothetical protein